MCDSGLGGLPGIRKWTWENMYQLVSLMKKTDDSKLQHLFLFHLGTPFRCTPCIGPSVRPTQQLLAAFIFSRPRNASVFTLQRICDGLEDPVSGTAWGESTAHSERIEAPLESSSNFSRWRFLLDKQSEVTIVIHTMLTKEAFLISQVTSPIIVSSCRRESKFGIFRRILWQKTRVLKLPFEGFAV